MLLCRQVHVYVVLTRCTVNFRYLFIEWCHFSSQSVRYLHELIHSCMNVTHHGCSLPSKRILCCLTFFFQISFFYNINKVEDISTATVCSTVLIGCMMLEAVMHSV